MEKYPMIFKLIDETLKQNEELIEFYKKSAIVYESKIAELQRKLEAAESANKALLKRVEEGGKK